MAAAQEAMEKRQARWMVENEVFEFDKGMLSYDHARIAAARAKAVAPVAAALRKGTRSDREFVERTLRFTQSIPYQKGKRGQDSGFQRPLALLARNKGDCDGKSALFLALIRAELPNVPLAMVYVPGHALVGVGIKPQKGDRTFRMDGRTYVMAEPSAPVHSLSGRRPVQTAGPDAAARSGPSRSRIGPGHAAARRTRRKARPETESTRSRSAAIQSPGTPIPRTGRPVIKALSPALSRLSNAAYRRHGDAVERAGSARRINRAADDAAGLGVATNLRTTERSQRAAMRNITTAQSIVSTAEGGLREITHNLQRMREPRWPPPPRRSTMTSAPSRRGIRGPDRRDRRHRSANGIRRPGTPCRRGNRCRVHHQQFLSMNPEIPSLLSAVSDFETRFADAGLDVSLSLSEVNAGKDTVDGSARLAGMGDGTFQSELATLSTQFGLQDPYAAVLEATGLTTITGDIDPDDVGFRVGAKATSS